MQRVLALMILNWNGAKDTIELLESLTDQSVYDIYIFDNGSIEADYLKLKEYLDKNKYGPDVRVCDDQIPDETESVARVYLIRSKQNLGFAGGNNFLAKHLCKRYKLLLLLNNDTIVPPYTIENMVATIEKEKCTAITCDIRNYYHKDTLWNAGGKFMWYGDRKYFPQKKIDALERKGVTYIRADFITGCALMIDSCFVKEFGLFSDKFFHGEEDYNLCLRMKKMNKPIGVDLKVRLYHKIGSSINRATQRKETNAMVVHFANRIIDSKDFMSHTGWLVWEKMYLLALFVKGICKKKSVKDMQYVITRINSIIKNYDKIDKELFIQIANE